MMATVEDLTAPGRDWAVPGSSVDQPTADDGIATGATLGSIESTAPSARPWVTPAGEAAAAAHPVPRVALRPMTVADILDGGFAVVKARPLRILAITAAFVVPTHLLAAYLQRDALGGLGVVDLLDTDPTVLEEQANADPTGQLLATLVVALIPAIALVCVAAAVAHLVGQWTMGRDAPAGEMLSLVFRRGWPLLASFVLVKLAEAAGIFGFYIGLVFVMGLFVVVAPVIGVEGCGPVEALKRSVRLTRARYFPTLGTAVLMGIVSGLLANALSALPQGLAFWIGLDSGWPLLALGSIVAEVVVLPFVAAATVLLYLDLRVRTEGLDIEMSAVDVLDRAG
jgi:Family of unknown function (DUF6159)